MEELLEAVLVCGSDFLRKMMFGFSLRTNVSGLHDKRVKLFSDVLNHEGLQIL